MNSHEHTFCSLFFEREFIAMSVNAIKAVHCASSYRRARLWVHSARQLRYLLLWLKLFRTTSAEIGNSSYTTLFL